MAAVNFLAASVRTLERRISLLEAQVQVPTVQKVQKTVEGPQVEYVDNHVLIPVHKQRPVPMVPIAQRHVEASTVNVQFVDKIVPEPDTKEVHVPTVQEMQKTVEVPQVEYVDKHVHIPVPMVTTGQKQVEGSAASVQFVDKVATVRVTKEVQLPTVQKVQKTLEMPQVKHEDYHMQHNLVPVPLETDEQKHAKVSTARVQFVDKVEPVPATKKVQVPRVHKVQKKVEVPRVEYGDDHVHIPVHKHHTVPKGTVEQKHVEVSTARVQFDGKVEPVPVTKEVQVPRVQSVQKKVEVPRGEYADNHVYIPVHKHHPVPMVTVEQKHVEASTVNVQFVDKVVPEPVTKKGHVPRKMGEVPQAECVDNQVHIPTSSRLGFVGEEDWDQIRLVSQRHCALEEEWLLAEPANEEEEEERLENDEEEE